MQGHEGKRGSEEERQAQWQELKVCLRITTAQVHAATCHAMCKGMRGREGVRKRGKLKATAENVDTSSVRIPHCKAQAAPWQFKAHVAA